MATRYLVDSSVLIDLSLGIGPAGDFIDDISPSAVIVHPVVEAEVLVGAIDRDELDSLRDLLAGFRRVRLAPADFDHCHAAISRLTLAHGIGWPDCLIAATALRLHLPVATLDERHFRLFRGLQLMRPY